VKIFLSYPSGQRNLAERLALALEAEGHEVFIDRADLKAGESFHQPLREAILDADAMVFLVTPQAVAAGSYALAELNIARQRWRRPSGNVLPVMVVATPISALPSYLSAVTVLQPQGEAVAEIVAAVARMKPPSRPRRGWVGAVAALVLVALATAGGLLLRHEQQSAAQQARRDLAQAASARELCDSGSHALAMTQLNELVAGRQPPAQVLDAREDCAMRWLREMRATVGRTTFAEQVAQVQPVLLQGLARTEGVRAADLRSHIGWGEYLRGREGAAGADPVAHWTRALADDAGNVYAHAMWARQMLLRGGLFEEALALFDKAEASGRDRPFVRSLQFGGTLGGRMETAPYAVAVADRMRRGGEVIEEQHRDALWSGALGYSMLSADTRVVVLDSLPPAPLLETFDWLFPKAKVSDERRALWRFVRATLLANNGEREAALDEFRSLVGSLRAANHEGRLLEEAQRGLDRLR
jgi:tetratricopeptide (TPR) repeat protein